MAARRTPADLIAQVSQVLSRARARQQITSPGRLLGRLATTTLCLLAGLMVVVGALNSRGIDLRPGRNTDLVSLVQAQSRRNAELAREASTIRQEVDRLTEEGSGTPDGDEPDAASRLNQQFETAGVAPARGPMLSVTLDDAPSSVTPAGVDADLLVVHQQDIQAIVNILWQAGAEAMTIQDQRVISTTGIKCVGNTVVLHGTPYAPPYVIKAIGDRGRLEAGLADSEFVAAFQRYVDSYGLVYRTAFEPDAILPEHQGSMELRYAEALPPSGESPRDR